MSNRKTVIDALIDGLEESTGINKVTRELEGFRVWDEGDFPGVTLVLRPAAIDRISYPCTTSEEDMEARMPVECRGYTKDLKGGDLFAHKANLLDTIETQLKSSTHITGATKDIEIENVETDKGQIENHGICSVNCIVIYHYNHLDP